MDCIVCIRLMIFPHPGGVKFILQKKADLVASAAVVDEYGFHAPVVRSILRQTLGPFRSGELFLEIGEIRKGQLDLLFSAARKLHLCRGHFKSHGLRPDFILAAAERRKSKSSRWVRVHRGRKRFARVPRGNAHAFERFSIGGFHRARKSGVSAT